MFAKDINPKLVLPIHTEHPLEFMNPNIEELKKELEKAGFRVEVDDRSEKIGYKIREAQTKKIPYHGLVKLKEYYFLVEKPGNALEYLHLWE